MSFWQSVSDTFRSIAVGFQGVLDSDSPGTRHKGSTDALHTDSIAQNRRAQAPPPPPKRLKLSDMVWTGAHLVPSDEIRPASTSAISKETVLQMASPTGSLSLHHQRFFPPSVPMRKKSKTEDIEMADVCTNSDFEDTNFESAPLRQRSASWNDRIPPNDEDGKCMDSRSHALSNDSECMMGIESTSLNIASSSDKRAYRSFILQSVSELHQGTLIHFERLEPELCHLMEKLESLDPTNTSLRLSRDIVSKIRVLLNPSNRQFLRVSRNRRMLGRYSSSCASSSSHVNDSSMQRDVKDAIWKAEQRSILVRHQLQIAFDLVRPEIFALEKRRFFLSDSSLTNYVFKFVSFCDIQSCASVCKHWKNVVKRQRLLYRKIESVELRYKYWTRCISKRRKQRHHRTKLPPYGSLLTKTFKTDDSDHEQIKRDVRRTTFCHPLRIYNADSPESQNLLRVGESKNQSYQVPTEVINHYQAMLCRILKAYCVYNPCVGYCQGMTHLAALILSAMNFHEERSFVVFAGLMEAYDVQEIFQDGLPGTILRFYQLERLMKRSMPDLTCLMEQHQIAPIMYASGWVMTLFSNEYNLPPVVNVIILDLFFDKGWAGLFSLILGVFAAIKQRLLGNSMSIVLQELSKWTKNVSSEAFLHAASDIEISEELLENLELEYLKLRDNENRFTWRPR